MDEIIRIKCVLLGDANAGKTSLVLRYTKDQFTTKCQTTIGCTFKSKELKMDNKIIKLDIWDTAGQEKYRSLLPLYYRKAKLVLLCFDLSQYDTNLENNISYWLEELNKHSEIDNRVLFFVGTKSDIKCEEVGKQIEKLQNLYTDIIYIETSSKDGTNINSLFEYSTKEVLSKLVKPLVIVDPIYINPVEEETGCFKCSIS